VATVAFLHAHPDDECLTTGGTMARLAAEGHRVVLITATKGELGEVPEGMLAEGEQLWERRMLELHESAQILGVSHGQFLEYRDSGMVDTEANADPACFWQADIDTAAGQVADILREQGVDVLVVYDERGNYGHPDHIQVHRVGTRAADLAGTAGLYQATVDRDAIIAMIREGQAAGEMDGEGAPDPDSFDIGMPGSAITTRVDVNGFTDTKRAAMRCHKTQISDVSFFLQMPDDVFARAFGTEWYIKVRGPETETADHLV
jgi:LmbE family N-acetylglucosaminyl deacetylase